MNIIVDLNYPIQDGTEVKFRSPVDCSQVTGLMVNYNGGSQEFMFADAHGNDVGNIDHLFAEDVVVKVILDVTTGMAFVQNADTNAYLEGRLKDLEDKIVLPVDPAHGEHAKFFDVDYDGIISLKPEYRGDPNELFATNYPFSKSDNGIGVEGSKISELPERLVIPHNVNGESVTGFKVGMFSCNKRIKEVVLPTTVKAIAKGMFREAIHLEKVENTEQIVTIGTAAFLGTRIEEIRFPNLVSVDIMAFQTCSCLRIIDIGKITSIPAQMFNYCENLSEVLGGENVKTVGKRAFFSTRRLKELSFIPKVTSVGHFAFFSSRCNVDEFATGCSFGDYATYKQFGDADYWSNATFTPCKNQLNSLFHQKDARWADKQIGNYTKNGVPLTYGANGCSLVTLAEIYSAFEDVHFDSPEEFVPILESKGLTHLNFRVREDWCQMANGLGYETEFISTMTTANLQKVYDALAQGALCYRSVATCDDTGVADLTGGHATLVYGINTEGEMLASDTSMHCNEIGIYKNHKTAWHIYKHGSKECDCVIVRKP